MKLAETVRSRCALVLVSVAVGATAIVAASKTCDHARRQHDAEQIKRTGLKTWRGCHQRVAKPAPSPVREASGADYHDVLYAARPAFEACMREQPEGVAYSVRAQIDASGRVRSVDVRGQNEDLSKVDLHVVKCIEQTISVLQFPPKEASVATTFITPPPPTLIANEPPL